PLIPSRRMPVFQSLHPQRSDWLHFRLKFELCPLASPAFWSHSTYFGGDRHPYNNFCFRSFSSCIAWIGVMFIRSAERSSLAICSNLRSRLLYEAASSESESEPASASWTSNNTNCSGFEASDSGWY